MEKELFDQLMSSLEDAIAYSKGDKSRAKEVVVEVPDPVPEYTAADVTRTRKALNLSQWRFADALGVSPHTVVAWEDGTEAPSGAALHLLYLFDSDHSLVDRLVVR